MVKKPAKKKNSAKKAKATVHVGMQRLEKIKKAADKAGLGKDFEKALGKNKETIFIRMDRKRFDKLKGFVASHPKLAPHMDDCDCDPNDPFCICI